MSDPEFDRVTLRNGERAVRHLASGEVMHPAVGPWKEANLLYVEQPRLMERLQRGGDRPFSVWDVGLGAATNAVAALTAAARVPAGSRRVLEISSFELTLEPLRLALGDPDGFPELEPWRDAAEALMRDGRVEGDGWRWRLHLGDFLEQVPRASPGALVWFDPFSSDTNPSLWTPEAFKKLRLAATDAEEGTLLVTYSASTRARVSLLEAGFFVGAGVGVGGRKETTVAATRLDLLEAPLDARWLARWRRSDARAPYGHEAVPDLAKHPQFVGAAP